MVLVALLRLAGLDETMLSDIALTGAEPALPSSFAVGTAAQATIAAAALAAGELWRLRTGRRQRVSVDMRDAAIEFRSERYLRVNGVPAHDGGDKIQGVYRCGGTAAGCGFTPGCRTTATCSGCLAATTTAPR